MRFEKRQTGQRIGPPLTALGKLLLLSYGLCYIFELIFEHWLHLPVVRLFQLYPFEDINFRAWQFFTHPFIQNPSSPIDFLLCCLLFYFFAGVVEKGIGTKRFLIFFCLSAYGGALCGLFLSGISGFGVPFYGITPSLLAMVTVFGLLSPDATILLMFVIPIKAKYLSLGTILIIFLSLLSKSNPGAIYQLGGILVGFLYFNGFRQTFEANRRYLNYLYQQRKKQANFRVIDGAKDDDSDKPTYH